MHKTGRSHQAEKTMFQSGTAPCPLSLPVSAYTHPVSIGALTLLALNDHCLKGSGLLPPWVTGKLSDGAGMIFFPLLLVGLWNTGQWLIRRYRRKGHAADGGTAGYCLTHRQLIVAITVTGLLFTGLQLSSSVVNGYCYATSLVGIYSNVTRDITDLFALPALVVPYMIGRRLILPSSTDQCDPSVNRCNKRNRRGD
jgi:hypothetical protein